MECPNCGAILGKGKQKVITTAVSHEVSKTRAYRCLECNSVNCSVELFLKKEQVEWCNGKHPKQHIKRHALVKLLKALHDISS